MIRRHGSRASPRGHRQGVAPQQPTRAARIDAVIGGGDEQHAAGGADGQLGVEPAAPIGGAGEVVADVHRGVPERLRAFRTSSPPYRRRVGHRGRRAVGHLVWSAPVRARRLARHRRPGRNRGPRCVSPGSTRPRPPTETGTTAAGPSRRSAASHPIDLRPASLRKYADTRPTTAPQGSVTRNGNHGSPVASTAPANGTASIARSRVRSSSSIAGRTITDRTAAARRRGRTRVVVHQ